MLAARPRTRKRHPRRPTGSIRRHLTVALMGSCKWYPRVVLCVSFSAGCSHSARYESLSVLIPSIQSR